MGKVEGNRCAVGKGKNRGYVISGSGSVSISSVEEQCHQPSGLKRQPKKKKKKIVKY